MVKPALKISEIKSWREFERELETLGEDIRRTIQLEVEAFSPDPQASKARRERAQNDYQFFCQTYFPHYVPTAFFSLFQHYIFTRLPAVIDGERDGREVHLAPRGEAKSTYETQLGTLWCIVTNRKHLIGIIMNTLEQSAEMLASIKSELDTNPRLMLDFPAATGQGRVWQATTILTANNIKVRIGGTGKKLRGMKHGPYRPDLIFLDDLENDENIKKKEQRDKTRKYVLSAVLGLAPPIGGMDVFWVGTSLHYNAAINQVGAAPGWRKQVFRAIMTWPDNMHLWDQWEAIYTRTGSNDEREDAETAALKFYKKHQAAMEAGAVVSWPDVRPLYKLMCIRATDHQSFSQEYQNEAGNDDNAPFKTIQFWVNRLPEWIFFGAIDPSMGKQLASRDPSAILVGGMNPKTCVLDVVEADIQRRVPDLIISRAVELQMQYNCVMWSVECVAFQEFLYTELIKRAAFMGCPFPAMPGPTGRNKELAILSLQPHVKNGLFRLHRNQSAMVDQMTYWPEADHDDGPDAGEMLWRIATQFVAEWQYTAASTARKSSRRGSSAFNEWDDDED